MTTNQRFFQKVGIADSNAKSSKWDYTRVFAGDTIEASYDSLKKFLLEEGFIQVILPKDTDELYLINRSEEGKSYQYGGISIEFYAYDEKALVLRIANEDYPNRLIMTQGGYDREEMERLKRYRIKEAIEYVETAHQSEKIPKYELTSVERLKEIQEALLEVNIDKTTIVAAMLQDAYHNEIIDFGGVKKTFGEAVALRMEELALGVF